MKKKGTAVRAATRVRMNFHDTVLSVIDILKFIDQYIFKPVLPVCTLHRIPLQKLLAFL